MFQKKKIAVKERWLLVRSSFTNIWRERCWGGGSGTAIKPGDTLPPYQFSNKTTVRPAM